MKRDAKREASWYYEAAKYTSGFSGKTAYPDEVSCMPLRKDDDAGHVESDLVNKECKEMQFTGKNRISYSWRTSSCRFHPWID